MSRNHTGRLKQLEKQFSGELSGKQQLEVYLDALYGCPSAIEKFESLCAVGKIMPFLKNLYDIERAGPVYPPKEVR